MAAPFYITSHPDRQAADPYLMVFPAKEGATAFGLSTQEAARAQVKLGAQFRPNTDPQVHCHLQEAGMLPRPFRLDAPRTMQEIVQRQRHILGLWLKNPSDDGHTLCRFAGVYTTAQLDELLGGRELPRGFVCWHLDVDEVGPDTLRGAAIAKLPRIAGWSMNKLHPVPGGLGEYSEPLPDAKQVLDYTYSAAIEWVPAPEPVDPDACQGCGCVPGDGLTAGCNHPEGCGFFRSVEQEQLPAPTVTVEGWPLHGPGCSCYRCDRRPLDDEPAPPMTRKWMGDHWVEIPATCDACGGPPHSRFDCPFPSR